MIQLLRSFNIPKLIAPALILLSLISNVPSSFAEVTQPDSCAGAFAEQISKNSKNEIKVIDQSFFSYVASNVSLLVIYQIGKLSLEGLWGSWDSVRKAGNYILLDIAMTASFHAINLGILPPWKFLRPLYEAKSKRVAFLKRTAINTTIEIPMIWSYLLAEASQASQVMTVENFAIVTGASLVFFLVSPYTKDFLYRKLPHSGEGKLYEEMKQQFPDIVQLEAIAKRRIEEYDIKMDELHSQMGTILNENRLMIEYEKRIPGTVFEGISDVQKFVDKIKYAKRVKHKKKYRDKLIRFLIKKHDQRYFGFPRGTRFDEYESALENTLRLEGPFNKKQSIEFHRILAKRFDKQKRIIRTAAFGEAFFTQVVVMGFAFQEFYDWILSR